MVEKQEQPAPSVVSCSSPERGLLLSCYWRESEKPPPYVRSGRARFATAFGTRPGMDRKMCEERAIVIMHTHVPCVAIAACDCCHEGLEWALLAQRLRPLMAGTRRETIDFRKMRMGKPEIEAIAERLAAVLARARKEAVAYAVLTVLSTPAFVAIASLVAASVLVYVLDESHYRIDSALAVYTGMTIFLASVLGLSATNPGKSSSFALDRAWLAGVIVLLVLAVVTYATPLMEKAPVFFGIVCFVLGFLTLGLIGRAQANRPAGNPVDEPPTFRALVLAVSDFVLSAYGELLSASWLWFPPKPHEVRVAAHVLSHLATPEGDSLHERAVDNRIERLLLRLGLVAKTDQQLYLTPKGSDFVRAAMTR